jgi:enoyl-CoA hydratase/carnithine racemase
VERDDGVGIVTLNRPKALNAMNRKLGAELLDAVKSLEADDEIGCLVITGAGDKAFSAGGDIKEQVADDQRYTRAEQQRLGNPRRTLEISLCAKPTIGMMNGLAYGGAAVLASSLDIRVGCETSRFRFLAAAYGRINATWSLGSQIGWPQAKELLFTARIVEAEEAYRIGLLNHLVPKSELRTKTMEIARMIAGNHRGAVKGVKALLLEQQGGDLAARLGRGAPLHHGSAAWGASQRRIPRVSGPQGYRHRLTCQDGPARRNVWLPSARPRQSARWSTRTLSMNHKASPVAAGMRIKCTCSRAGPASCFGQDCPTPLRRRNPCFDP